MILRSTKGPEDWRDFLADRERHWKPGRSAMEAAHSWEAQKGLPPEIAALFPKGTELLLAIPEYKVVLPGGGHGSLNDVFALLRDDSGLTVCMVEAKRDESFGPRLGDWRHEASAGKAARLEFICETLGIDDEDLADDQRYQFLHRAASAVVTAERFHAGRAALIVQSFSPENRGLADFARFASLFGLEGRVGASDSFPTPDGVTLRLGWARCSLRTFAG